MQHNQPLSPPTAADTYELSPMQRAMLFHTLESPGAGVYGIQVSYQLCGRIDLEAMARAWQTVVDRHEALRTSFHWDGLPEPRQAVQESAELPVEQKDWRVLDEDEQTSRLEDLLRAESRRGFDLTRAPLMRIVLVRCTDEVTEMVLVHHHLLFDGGSKETLFDEVFESYHATLEGRPATFSPAVPYRRYIEWLRARDLAPAEAFWRSELAGFREPTPLWPSFPEARDHATDYSEHPTTLAESATDALREAGRRSRLTLNAVVQGIWALLLMAGSDRDDVVFGAIVNGRPLDLAEAERIVGLFINTLPVRVRLAPGQPLGRWLAELQTAQARARDYSMAALSEIRSWSEVSGGRALLESVVVFENNAGFGNERERRGTLEVYRVRPLIRNSLPLTLRCVPGRAFSFQLLHDARRFSASTIGQIADAKAELLRTFPERLEEPVDAVLSSIRSRMQARRERAHDGSARRLLARAQRRRRPS